MRLGFLASHRGSNMQAILDACADGRLAATPAVLICNNRGAECLARAARVGFPSYVLNAATHPDPAALDAAMLDALTANETELVVLAGFMKKIGPRVLAAFAGRIVNIHPALLPKYGGHGMYGANVHRAVLAAGEKSSGATVHLVDEIYDNGRILSQAEVPVQPGDTVETLSARVLVEEHKLLVHTLQRIATGDLKL